MKSPTTTYSVRNMRLVPTAGKVAQKNPDRLGTVHGEFHAVDDKGKVSADPLSFTQKEITREIAANPLTVIDIENGLLTLPAGERGRKAVAGIDQDAVNALLASVREPATEPDADNAAEPAS